MYVAVLRQSISYNIGKNIFTILYLYFEAERSKISLRLSIVGILRLVLIIVI